MKYIGAVKNGKLANGFERDKGRVIHIIEGGGSLCGARPVNGWSERHIKEASCNRCIAKLERELVMKNLLGQIDNMIEEEK